MVLKNCRLLPGLSPFSQVTMAADLVLIDGNPDEDLSCMYKRPEKVWKKGRLVRGTTVEDGYIWTRKPEITKAAL